MDYTSKGIELKIPKDSQGMQEYFSQIKEANMPKDYYVQFGVDTIEELAINCYMEDNINYLAIEFKTPTGEIDEAGNEVKRKERLIIGKKTERIGNYPRN